MNYSVLFNVIMMTTSINGITSPLSAAAQAAGAAMLFYIGIDVPRPATGGLKAPDVSAKGDLVLSNVNFAYPGRPDLRVLDDLSITFPAGKTTAIVGPSGSGKSTIVALLERWYDLARFDTNPAIAWLRNGSITAAGTPLKEMDLKWWRAQIGLVQQEPVLFNDTILHNVEHGLIGSEWADEPAEEKRRLVEEACKEAFAEEFILRLPEVCAHSNHVKQSRRKPLTTIKIGLRHCRRRRGDQVVRRSTTASGYSARDCFQAFHSDLGRGHLGD